MRIFLPWRTPGRWALFRMDDRLLLILMGVIVGVSSGVAAVALNRMLVALTARAHLYREFGLGFMLPAIGAALSSLFINHVVREGAGHGVPEVIYAVSRYGGLIRFRSSFSRLISSCLTIGTGGSAGPEAPVVMSGSAIGSNIARFFSLNDRQRITLVGCGAAGAISAIFNAPISGLVFTVEVILGEWKARNIVPIAIASVSGTQISRLFRGDKIVFHHRVFDIGFPDILATAGLALATAGASVLLARALRGMHHVSGRVALPPAIRAAIGGCAVGAIGLVFPAAMGEGYHSIQEMIHGALYGGMGFAFMGVLLKIAATAFTLGWGGSGGIFAPSLVVGSFMGVAYRRGLQWAWPGVAWVDEGCFALLGMSGLLAGILQAPLTAIFLIVEITGGYEVIVPLIMVSALSSTVCHYIEPSSFYLKELVDRGQLLRPGTDARVLSDLAVEEMIERDCIPVRPDLRLRDFVDVVRRSRRNYFPVVDEETREFLGLIHLDDVRPFLFDAMMYDAVLMEEIMRTGVDVVHPDDDLAEVLRHMDENRLFSMAVVSSGRFLGMISKGTLLDRYRKELRVQTAG
jgi:chloride channel protein, CIC family